MKKLLIFIFSIAFLGATVFFIQKFSTKKPAIYKDVIEITEPIANTVITSPLIVRGQARGVWFFEASFPVVLKDAAGQVIARGIAQAQDDWMTNDFVPFEAQLEFDVPKTKNGTLILHKDNPSDMRQFDDAFEIPVLFK